MFSFSKNKKIKELQAKIDELSGDLADSKKINLLLNQRIKSVENIKDDEIRKMALVLSGEIQAENSLLLKKKDSLIQSLSDKLRNSEHDFSKLFSDTIMTPRNQNNSRVKSYRRPKRGNNIPPSEK